jgi:tetratricopeptide (TPR) repeat protein
MADSSRTDSSRAIDPAPDAGRDAKIEQLLLGGLDHYFAGRYERAINVWTRALFFDRSHARARAYIDRARSALAERQRRAEELLENGVEALDRGQGTEARRLLQAAVENGARLDELHPLLERLNRQSDDGQATAPDTEPPHAPPSRLAGQPARPAPPQAVGRWSSVRPAAVAIALVLAAVGIGLYWVAVGKEPRLWFAGADAIAPSSSAPPLRETVFPLPRRGEMALNRAHALALRGRLHEALAALDLVRATDAEKPEADALRSDLQHQLLQLAATPAPDGGDARDAQEGQR